MIANSKIGAFATGNYLLRHDHSENILRTKIKHFQFVQYLSPGPRIRGEIGGSFPLEGDHVDSNIHAHSVSNDKFIYLF